ncbi:MAG: ribonuclease III [FCB group bacterium]|jgi:ribonuclease-3|nr:ribonuclease III [FCB group bacterium]
MNSDEVEPLEHDIVEAPGVPTRDEELLKLAQRLGYTLDTLPSLDKALTHASSACQSEVPVEDYESLEFLGDAALGLAVAHGLFERLPDRSPGEYSRLRAGLVNRRSLARMAQQLDIAPAIRLGRGEELSGGRERSSLLADCLEALIGAIYTDRGWDEVREFVEHAFGEDLDRAGKSDKLWDYKSRLQHYCQAQHMPLPNFVVVTSRGPDHHKVFEVEVLLQGKPAGRGCGLSKKEAEQNAARAALENEGQFPKEDSESETLSES